MLVIVENIYIYCGDGGEILFMDQFRGWVDVSYILFFVCKGWSYIFIILSVVRCDCYDMVIVCVVDDFGVEVVLVKVVIYVEFLFDCIVVLWVGVQGLMQLMLCIVCYLEVVDLFDVSVNIYGGICFFVYLQNKFSILDQVLVVYNVGEGNVCCYGGIFLFLEIRVYVKKVKELWLCYQL